MSATLGHVAAVFTWPHTTHHELRSIATALASGSKWPNTLEEYGQALDNASCKGEEMRTPFSASKGRPTC